MFARLSYSASHPSGSYTSDVGGGQPLRSILRLYNAVRRIKGALPILYMLDIEVDVAD